MDGLCEVFRLGQGLVLIDVYTMLVQVSITLTRRVVACASCLVIWGLHQVMSI